MEFNLEHGGFIPRVCSEGGPKAVWLSEKQYGYPFIFQFDIPKSMVSQLSNVDYIYEDAISFDDFNCHLVKTDISAHYDSFTVVLNILDDDLSKRQFAMFKDLGVVLWKEFKDYPMVLDKYINPFIEKHQSLEEEEIKDQYKLAPEPNDITPYYHVVDEAKNYKINEKRKDMSNKKLIIETKTSVGDFDYTPHIKSILKFMDERGYDIKPYPRIIIIDKDENKDTVLITTGNYSPSDRVVRLYVKDRHPKDVLRSFVHEMIHHMQNIRGGEDMD